MADKASTTKVRKTPVRTAPARKDYASEVEWLQAKLDHARQAQADADRKVIERLDKRIAVRQKVVDTLTQELRHLTEERDFLLGQTAAPATADGEAYTSVPADEV